MSYITDKANVKAMVKALENQLQVKADVTKTSYIIKWREKEIFRAMMGTSGKYLVRHDKMLFA